MSRCGFAVGQESKLFDPCGPAEMIALSLVARFVQQKFQFPRTLDAFGKERKAKAFSKTEHRAYDRCSLFICVDCFYERPVNDRLFRRTHDMQIRYRWTVTLRYTFQALSEPAFVYQSEYSIGVRDGPFSEVQDRRDLSALYAGQLPRLDVSFPLVSSPRNWQRGA